MEATRAFQEFFPSSVMAMAERGDSGSCPCGAQRTTNIAMETVTPHYLHVRPYTSRKPSAAAYPSRPVGDRRSKRHSLPVRDQTTNQPKLVLQHNGYGSSFHCRSRSFYCKSLPHGAIRLKSSDACCRKRLYTCVARWTICHGCVRDLSLRCQFLRRFDRPSPIR